MANNQLLASDNFASGALAPQWAPLAGLSVCQVVNAPPFVVQPNVAGTQAGQYWTGQLTNDHVCEVSVNTFSSNTNDLQLRVRWNNAAQTGYAANIGSLGTNDVQLYRQDSSSSFTQLGPTITGVTFAAGDVWSFMAAGSVLYLYQNGNLIIQAADTTYTSGTVAFAMNTPTSIATLRVSAWRAYNTVQQDGIWTKQGVTLAPNSGDLASSGYGAYQFTKILYEGNAQLLSGTVYKVLFVGGGATTANIYYAESLDGKTWSRRVSPVLSGISNAALFKNGSTYYLYGQDRSLGTSPIQLYSSSDMITWTLVSSSVLTIGGVGTWDHGSLFLLSPVDIINGTWYALYTGENGDGTASFKIGLATSPDGKTWTKYPGNPVISNAASSQAIAKVSGTYYGWFPAGPSSPEFTPGGNGYNPAETIRVQSTDLISWTNRVPSVHHSEMLDLVNNVHGVCVACSIINIGGKAYLYMISGQDQAAPQNYQTTLAIAPAPIESIITAKEDAASQVAADSFISGIGDLSSNWSTPTSSTKLQVVAGNLVEATATSAICSMYYAGASFSPNQYSEITIHTLSATGQFANPCVRMQSGAVSAYEVNIQGPTGSLVAGCQILKRVAGSATLLGPSQSITLQVGDVIRLQVVTGSDGFPVLSVFQNGNLIQQVQDYGNTFSSGAPGMLLFATTLADAQLSSWAGGNANVIPNYPPIPNPNIQLFNAGIGFFLGALAGSSRGR